MSRLRLPRHRATTGQACALYPFLAGAGLGSPGVHLGVDHLAGGAAFRFDPFDAYAAGLITNPNVLVAGEPGTGKSATVKALVHREVTVRRRWVAIADPKGEYAALAELLGLSTLRLAPGGSARINPLDPGPVAALGAAEVARRQATMLVALLGAVVGRDLEPVEDAALGWALAELGGRRSVPTLAGVAALLAAPTASMATRAAMAAPDIAAAAGPVRFALGKLLDRSLRGMFDGDGAGVDWDGPGLVVDLSALHGEPEALRAVLVAVTAWLTAMLARDDGVRRLLVLDEAWSLLASERTARFLQSSWKLGRAQGVANLAVLHRLSDLRSQADDGTAATKVATGLLADTATRVIFRQAADQVRDARDLLGLSGPEAELISRLARGRALWRVGSHAAVVAHHLSPAERWLADTDARMRP